MKFEELKETIRGMILCVKQIEQTMKKWEEKQQVMLSKVDWLEEERRKNNIVIFVLEEKRNWEMH